MKHVLWNLRLCATSGVILLVGSTDLHIAGREISEKLQPEEQHKSYKRSHKYHVKAEGRESTKSKAKSQHGQEISAQSKKHSIDINQGNIRQQDDITWHDMTWPEKEARERWEDLGPEEHVVEEKKREHQDCDTSLFHIRPTKTQ